MLILIIRTDKPDAEIGLYADRQQIAYETWPAHRQLAETIHLKLEAILRSKNKALQELQGVVIFKGPGSFTGLRIGMSVANALAYSLSIPVVAAEDPDWLQSGIHDVSFAESAVIALPEYGALPNITPQKK